MGKKADEQQTDLISESAEFIKEIDKLKSQNTEDLERIIDNMEVEWNKSNIEFDNFCVFFEKNRMPENNIIFVDENSKTQFTVKLSNVNESNNI